MQIFDWAGSHQHRYAIFKYGTSLWGFLMVWDGTIPLITIILLMIEILLDFLYQGYRIMEDFW